MSRSDGKGGWACVRFGKRWHWFRDGVTSACGGQFYSGSYGLLRELPRCAQVHETEDGRRLLAVPNADGVRNCQRCVEAFNREACETDG